MSGAIAFAMQLCDPRGRCDRKGFLFAAGILLAVQAVAALIIWVAGRSLDGSTAAAVSVVFCWCGSAILSKRLHDIGRSAWCLPLGVLAWFAAAIAVAVAVAVTAGPAVLEPGAAGYWATFSAMLLPLALVVLWLHMAAGEVGENRFGPPPVAGFSMPAAA